MESVNFDVSQGQTLPKRGSNTSRGWLKTRTDLPNNRPYGRIRTLTLKGWATMSHNLPIMNSTSQQKSPEVSDSTNVGLPDSALDNLARILDQRPAITDAANFSEKPNEARRLFDQAANQLRQKVIERFIAILIDVPEYETFEFDWIYDNAKARLEYLSATEFVSLDTSETSTRLTGSILSEWEKNKMIFAVNCFEKLLYPTFQFDANSPKPVIKEILRELPDHMNSWQIAFWFESNNGWLGGDIPKESLDRIDELMVAAQQKALAHCF